MSFRLTRIDEEIFSTPANGIFVAELSANRGSVAVLSVRYGSQHTTANPATFNVEASENDLIYVFQATNGDALIRLSEVDGAQKERLTSRPAFDGTLSVEIRTVAAAERDGISARKRAAKKARAAR